jgi:hypothetical protein
LEAVIVTEYWPFASTGMAVTALQFVEARSGLSVKHKALDEARAGQERVPFLPIRARFRGGIYRAV